jgi:hypothetical protein
MTLPLMPKATAVWLIENSKLTFNQIATFCGMHPLEVKAIADGEACIGIIGHDPVVSNQVTAADIAAAEANSNTPLRLSAKARQYSETKAKKTTRYTPIARRHDKPDAVAYILKNCPEITDNQIVKLIGTTKSTIEAVKTKSHWNMGNIRPRDPVLLGLCKQTELDNAAEKAKLLLDKHKKEES